MVQKVLRTTVILAYAKKINDFKVFITMLCTLMYDEILITNVQEYISWLKITRLSHEKSMNNIRHFPHKISRSYSPNQFLIAKGYRATVNNSERRTYMYNVRTIAYLLTTCPNVILPASCWKIYFESTWLIVTFFCRWPLINFYICLSYLFIGGKRHGYLKRNVSCLSGLQTLRGHRHGDLLISH